MILDVRKIDEYEAGHLPGPIHVFLGYLPRQMDPLPARGWRVTFCGSGRRASIAASLLRNAGREQVANNLGSMAACKAVGCELVR
jgi:hydroxyacylglutathione hydrolase